MENWDNMRYLLALYRHKTMSAAAQALNTNVATVSRRIERAAQTFGTPLFIKDASGWTPTGAVMPLIRVAEEFDAKLASERNNRAATEARGIEARIQIAAPAFFHTMLLVPQLHTLLMEHPGLEIDIRNRGEATGLGDADIMIRVGRPDSGRVVARRLTTFTFRAYRSTLAEVQMPGWVAVESRTGGSPQAILGARIFGGEPNVSVALFEQKITVMRSTGMAAVMAEQIAAQMDDFVELDPNGPTEESEIWMIYHATRRDDAAIRAVSDWIVECFKTGRIADTVSAEQVLDLAS